MNEQDKKAFEKWYSEYFQIEGLTLISIPDHFTNTWQAACKYKQKEIDEFQWELNYRSERIKKLRDENAKLRECVEFYADYKNDNPDNDWNNDYARQVLKELNKGESK